MNSLLDIIKSIDTKSPNLNPTEIYNEGWLTRLLVYYSIKEELVINDIHFSKINNWCSEALISSPFLPRKRGDKLAEGYTHADMAIGDFEVKFAGNKGSIRVKSDARLFGIIEAKMGSNLSQGTKNIRAYNQASRNLACISYNTFDYHDCRIFFGVVAPQDKIEEYNILKQVEKDTMLEDIKNRYKLYPLDYRGIIKEKEVLAKANQCNVWVISYEDWISKFSNGESKLFLQLFYGKTKYWNRI